MRTLLAVALLQSGTSILVAQSRYAGPVVDVNVRADPLSTERLREFDRFRVTHAMVFGRDSVVREWSRHWTGTVIRSVTIPCPEMNCYPRGGEFPDTTWLRTELQAGRVRGLGELMQLFSGMRPDDPNLQPYFALAAEFDVPVSIHMGLGPPWLTRRDTPFRTYLGKPALIEDVLARHRNLRVIVAHAGYPWMEEITALLYMYPNVSVDISAIALPRFLPPAIFQDFLGKLVRLGFTDRILFGSDVQDSKVTGETLEAIESAEFLTLEEKRGILCGNAKELFRLADLQCR